MENKITNYNSLDDSQKINYVKNLLFNSNLNDALDPNLNLSLATKKLSNEVYVV